jgi:hypothetical protein
MGVIGSTNKVYSLDFSYVAAKSSYALYQARWVTIKSRVGIAHPYIKSSYTLY